MSRDADALTLFERYLEMPVATRDGWLATATAHDPDLAGRIAAMIAADRSGVIGTGGAVRDAESFAAPDRIGAYRIEGLIGHGGMGSVYRGLREGTDFAHEVAIKIIKPGLLSERLDQRFRSERRLLAGLRHPNIAQLYDGGETPEGAPYIVMELVEGEPLLAFADARALSPDERAALFGTVCEAVAFAHRSLIVHRDITPSNIMVTADGLPKLIDFGIARAADVAADAEREIASLASLSLTPGYAAPERMTSTAITTAADIYSLGKVLGALLPTRDPELDAIIACATRADPAARYLTVEAFAADIAAWRRGLPVTAMGRGRHYRLAKFVRRHARAVIASAAAVLLLLGALGATFAAWRDAESARAAEARRFAEVRSLAKYLLFDLNDRLRRIPGSTAARADLAERAQAYLDRLAATPTGGRAVQLENAEGYLRLAEILGSPLDRNLGDVGGAKAALDKAGSVIERVSSSHGDAADLRVTRARVGAAAAMIAFHQEGNARAARPLLDRAQALLDAVPAAARDLGWHRAQREVSRSRIEFLMANEEMPAVAEAVVRHRQAVAAWPRAMRTGDAALIEHAFADYHQGAALTFSPREAEAFALLARTTRSFVAAERRRPGDPDLLYWIGWSGSEAFGSAARLKRTVEAAPLLEAARSAAERLVAVTDNDKSARPLWRSVNEVYALHLAEAGHAREALALQRAVIAANVRANGDDPEGIYAANLGYSEMMLGMVARRAGDRDVACRSWMSARRRFARAEREGALIGYHAAFLPGLDRNLAACAAGRPLSATTLLR